MIRRKGCERVAWQTSQSMAEDEYRSVHNMRVLLVVCLGRHVGNTRQCLSRGGPFHLSSAARKLWARVCIYSIGLLQQTLEDMASWGSE